MKIVRLQQGTDAWLQWRLQGIGGSDIAAILDVSPYEDATRANVLAEKVSGQAKPATFAMKRGVRLESGARRMFEARFRCQCPPVCVEQDDEPWIRASLDGLMQNGVVPQLLEIKAPNWQTHDRLLSGLVPDHFTAQVQWQLLATGADLCHLVSITEHRLFGPESKLAHVVIEADAEKQAELLEVANEFWQEVLDSRQIQGVS